MPTWNANTAVNVAGTEVGTFYIKASTPPNSTWRLFKSGEQTTSAEARGEVEKTPMYLTNLNLTHVCDFKFIFQFGLSLTSLVTAITGPILAVIKNAKLRAAAAVRAAMTFLVNIFRTAIKAVLAILTSDPSGVVSFGFSISKDLIRQIKEKVEKIAQYAEDALTVYFLIRDIQQIIAWIQTLPAKVQAMLKECLTKFQNGIKQTIASLQSIPGQVSSSLTSSMTELQNGMNASLNQLKSQSSSFNGTLDPALMPVLNGSTENADLAKLGDYISKASPTAGEAMNDTFGGKSKEASKP
jgi:CRISPR/Cas system-associated endoribonuclease Cas2